MVQLHPPVGLGFGFRPVRAWVQVHPNYPDLLCPREGAWVGFWIGFWVWVIYVQDFQDSGESCRLRGPFDISIPAVRNTHITLKNYVSCICFSIYWTLYMFPQLRPLGVSWQREPVSWQRELARHHVAQLLQGDSCVNNEPLRPADAKVWMHKGHFESSAVAC